MSTNQQGNSSSTNESSSNILFAAQEDSGENSNQSLLVDTASRQSCSQSQGHNNNNNSSSNNNINNHQNSPLLMEQSQSQSQLSQSQSQAMSEMLTQNAADFTQMTQDGDNENFSLSPFPPNTPVKPEEVPWGRLMPCSGGKAIELLPKAPPNSKRGAATTSRQQQQLFSILGMQNIHPFDQFNEFWLGRSVKCDFAISRPKKSTTIENADDGVIKEEKLEEWCYGLISNKHCRIYCALSEDAQSRGSTAGMEVWVEDSSNNGTTINQTILLKRGQKRLLNPGDEICLLNYETLCRKTLDDAIRQRMLRKHSFVFINVAQHQQPQQQHQQPQSKPRAAVPVPPFTITNSSARSRRGLVDPRAMNYHGNRSAGPWSKRMWQQQPNVPQRSPVPAYASAAAAPAVNSAFLSGGPAGINPAASNEKGGFGFSNYSSSSRAGFAALANKHAQRNMVTAKLTSSPQRRIEEEYDIRDLLGRGTCGEVRRAIHRTSGQQRAVKIVSLPSPGLMMNTTNKQQQQWQAEARILQTLEHPYIIKLVDVFRADSHLYLVMELSTGGDLFDRIVQRGKYTEDASRRVMRRLLSAVHYIHEDAEIVHRGEIIPWPCSRFLA